MADGLVGRALLAESGAPRAVRHLQSVTTTTPR